MIGSQQWARAARGWHAGRRPSSRQKAVVGAQVAVGSVGLRAVAYLHMCLSSAVPFSASTALFERSSAVQCVDLKSSESVKRSCVWI